MEEKQSLKKTEMLLNKYFIIDLTAPSSLFTNPLRELLDCALFCATYPFRVKSHETLPNVTYLATVEHVAKQVAETVAESRTQLYFLQRFQATFRFVAQSHVAVATCKHFVRFSQVGRNIA